MFSRAGVSGLSAWTLQPQWIQVRNMATLKDITGRLKSIKNTQKITKSMKMKAGIKGPEDKKKHLIGVSSDRGLCGAIHSSIAKQMKSETEEKPIFSLHTIASAESVSIYDDMDADVLHNYQEYNLANIIYYSPKESTTSEQSARMTAMDNASKNASEMIDKLTLTFNRTLQAVITKELIEIISGAAALINENQVPSSDKR
ncbi:hypothetical protein P7K49_026495 [Saguinus oedipus]|uniref:ATP synthase F(1) complex subunit gamma, mitochondrial n=1 Tax=Saguinus oedipus TaxID=9490 RepID=A0ABQ9UE52_SAGOE|nr:hypothetical protein P7K49_026495 [Saguinus oedipus]